MMQIQDILNVQNTVRLSFPIPDGCMECPLSRSDELGYPFECQWDHCPFNNPGEYYYDPEADQISCVSMKDAATPDDQFTTAEVAKMFGVKVSTIHRWIRSKRLISRCKTSRNGFVVYYGDLAKFCLDHPKYIWCIPLRVTAKRVFVKE